MMMTKEGVNHQEPMEALGCVMETCRAREHAYRRRAQQVMNSELKALFTLYASQSAQFVSELQHEGVHLGVEPVTSRSRIGAVSRDETSQAAPVAHGDEMMILAECERHEAGMVEEYEQAFKITWPTDLQRTLVRQYVQIRDAHDLVRDLRVTTSVGPSE